MTAASSVHSQSRALVGSLFVLGAGLCWSFTGVTLRLAPHLDSWQFLTYRSAGVAIAFAIVLHVRKPGAILAQLYSLGRLGAIVTAGLCVAAVSFIVAMKLTTVANALFLSSCSPLLASALAFFVLGERLSMRQAMSVMCGLVGIAIIVCGGLEVGDFIGNCCAALSALGFASASVAMRLGPKRDFNPALFGYGVFTAFLAAAACVWRGETLAAPLSEGLAAFGGGFVLMGVGFALFLRGAPSLPAVGQMVLAQTETVFGPVWVWLAFGETPSATTLLGGFVILIAVFSMALAGRSPPATAPPA